MKGILSVVISTSRWVGRYIAPPSLQPGEARVEMPIVPTPRYSPLVHVIRLTEERQTVSCVCIRKRSGEARWRVLRAPSSRGWEIQGDVMTTLQAMYLGAMLAWTPSLVVLAWLLREAPLDELQHDPS
jgi:hypothetical protein